LYDVNILIAILCFQKKKKKGLFGIVHI
jgi:hypothetical protein